MTEVLGAVLFLGALAGLAIGSVGTPIICLVVGAWRSSGLAHVRTGWGVAAGFGIGTGALLINIVVAVLAFRALVDAAPVVSGEWGALYVALVCPFLTAPLAVAATWMTCSNKERRERALGRKAPTACRNEAVSDGSRDVFPE
ncbi:MAG: hypothetical protein OXD31_02055 [Chloroflexi bacterium]|nr:hypothetical protein [Chloroflexota bacterium]